MKRTRRRSKNLFRCACVPSLSGSAARCRFPRMPGLFPGAGVTDGSSSGGSEKRVIFLGGRLSLHVSRSLLAHLLEMLT